MAATPASVGVVRRVVDDVLHAWGQDGLVDDVALCVTELSTNSTLHGASHFEVEVALLDQSVQVSVLDDGTTPASAIASRVSVAGLDALDTDIESPGMTGRGLFIVSALAADWGIEDVERGVRIWALFRPETVMAALRQPQVRPRPSLLAAAGRVASKQATVPVRLLDCPPELLVAHDDGLADLLRELQVMTSTDDPDHERRSTLSQLADVVRRSRSMWDATRTTGREATHAGLSLVDVELATRRSTVHRDVEGLRSAVALAEELSRRGELITVPASPAVRAVRDWIAEQQLAQAADGAAPTSFPDWLAPVAARPTRS